MNHEITLIKFNSYNITSNYHAYIIKYHLPSLFHIDASHTHKFVADIIVTKTQQRKVHPNIMILRANGELIRLTTLSYTL